MHIVPEACCRHANNDFIAKHSGLIESTVRAVVNRYARGLQEDDVNDLRQAGRVALELARRRFDPNRGVALSTFAFSLIRNEVIDELKRLKRPLAPPGLLVEEGLREGEHWIKTESDHGRRADLEMVERCVKQFVSTLPPRQAAVIAALFNDDLSQAQAARALHVSRPRIAQILKEVRAKGRSALAGFTT
jgi:RNA polymerase sigma factor (sigma-70 family)